MITKEKIADLQIEYIKPSVQDGASIYELVKESNALDVNSQYSYLMMVKFFQHSCIIAKFNQTLAGFVIAFPLLNKQDTLFVWQIGVSHHFRRQGVGTKMLEALLASEDCKQFCYIEATITPSNRASQSLFIGLAKKGNTHYEVSECFPAKLFGGTNHEDEILYRIGPFSK